MRIIAISVLWVAACASPAAMDGEPTATTKPADDSVSPTLALQLPAPARELSPSHVQIKGTGAQLADVGRCQRCHADIVAQWSSSVHAMSSFSNPFYRISVERFRDRRGNKASRFCAGCHDLALLADGAMDEVVEADDPRAHAGVTCFVCHGATAATVDGNASLTIDVSKIVVPSAQDKVTVDDHRASVKPLAGPELCGACHRAFLSDEVSHPSFLPGLDDYGSWLGSAYASSGIERVDEVEPRACRQCHMRPERVRYGDRAASSGQVSSHRFVGGHTHLAQMRGDREQLAKTREQLQGKVSLDVAAIFGETSGWHRPAEAGRLAPGEVVRIDVVLRNLGVGHVFPGGVTDAQDTWLEVEIGPQGGPALARSGYDGGHVLRTVILGPDGAPRLEREVDEFRAKLADQLVRPRGARVVRYQWRLPTVLPERLEVRARLLHRSRTAAIRAAVCTDSQSRKGQMFAKAAHAAGRGSAGACQPAPVTVVASAKRTVSEGGVGVERFRRLYDHGEALLSQVQERVDEARDSLTGAWELASSKKQRAKVAVAMIKLEGRLGRFKSAQRWAREAKALGANVPANAALARAAARVWRWAIAARAWAEVARLRPRSLSAWRGLATAYGSLGEDRRAIEASTSGLRLAPRDPDLLRIQAVASRSQKHDQRQADVEDAFARFRLPDEATRLRIRCAAEVPGCANERLPVPLRMLTAPH